MTIKCRSVAMATVSWCCSMISRGKCLELNFTTSEFLNKLSEHLFGIIKICKSQFKTNVSVSKRGFSI